MFRSRRRPHRIRAAHARRLLAIALGAVALAVASGCAQTPLGPAFSAAPAPVEPRARIYIYRAEGPGSFSKVHVTLDGREVGHFRSSEYETLEVASGSHHLRAGLRNLALVAWGWNDQRLHLDPAETLYVELSVRLTEREAPVAAGLEIAGRGSGAASENVYLQIKPAAEALEALSTMTRLPR